jgi:hypothetical protein
MPEENNRIAISEETSSVRIKILPLPSTTKAAASVNAKSKTFATHK